MATVQFSCTAVVILLLFFQKPVINCPTMCKCKWKGNRRTVECADRNLTVIVSGISSDTQILQYSNNRLVYLPAEVFQQNELINLQKLYLSSCQIGQIHERAFVGLQNLIELDLSNNTLVVVPHAAFSPIPLLMRLSLAGNPIDKLRAGQFASVPFLTSLDLSDCLIDDLQSLTFEKVDRLQFLKLHGNRLTVIKNVASVIPNVSSDLSLQPNPWICDCHLAEFSAWLKNHIRPLTVEPICQEPAKYRGVSVRSLNAIDFACLPHIVPSSSYVEIEEGKNISLVCQVSAIPEANISWELEGAPATTSLSHDCNNTASNVYRSFGSPDKISELFIFDATLKNNGTYKCVAKNPAGSSSSNFTVRILRSAESSGPSGSEATVTSYEYILFSSAITLAAVIAVLLLVVSWVICYKRSFRQTKMISGGGRQSGRHRYVILNKTMTSSVVPGKPLRALSPSSTSEVINPDLIGNTTVEDVKDMRQCLCMSSTKTAVERKYASKVNDNNNNGVNRNNDDDELAEKLFYSLQLDGGGGARITLHINPMEYNGSEIGDRPIIRTIDGKIVGLQYPCGCFYPIVSDDEPYNDQIAGGIIYQKEDYCENATRADPTTNFTNGKKHSKSTTSLHLSQTSLKSTPILSPPDPFKSDIISSI